MVYGLTTVMVRRRKDGGGRKEREVLTFKNTIGTYDATCDSSRQYTGIGSILKSAGKTDLLAYMNQYWLDENGDNESFWEHEWGKHGTCISTLETKCYTDYTSKQEVPDYFQKAVDLFKTLDSYTVSFTCL